MSEQIDLEIKELSVELNNKILQFEKKFGNKWEVNVVLPQMSMLPKDDFSNEPKFKLILVYP